MGVDIGIAVYDENREKRYALVLAILQGLKYADDEMKAECPFDVEEYQKEERKLRHDRWASMPPESLKLVNLFKGERWANLGIYINPFMEFQLGEELVLYPGKQMDYYIKVLERFVLASSKDGDNTHVKNIHNLFIEMRDNNLMLYPA